MKDFKEMAEVIRQEEAAKARVEVYQDIIEKQEKLSILGIPSDSLTTELRAELKDAVQEAKKARIGAIRKSVTLEIEETAKLDGYRNPALLAQALSEHIHVDKQTGEMRVIDPATKLPMRDPLSGRPVSISGLVDNARHSPDLGVLFLNSGNNSKGEAKPARFSTQNIKNPWKKGTLNLTKQALLVRENPALAKQLMEEAQG